MACVSRACGFGIRHRVRLGGVRRGGWLRNMRVLVGRNRGVRQWHRAAAPAALARDLLELFDRDAPRLCFNVSDTLTGDDVNANDVRVFAQALRNEVCTRTAAAPADRNGKPIYIGLGAHPCARCAGCKRHGKTTCQAVTLADWSAMNCVLCAGWATRSRDPGSGPHGCPWQDPQSPESHRWLVR